MYVISGIFQIELQFLLIFLNGLTARGDSTYLNMLDEFMQAWRWPTLMSDCSDVFSDDIDLTRDHFKCDAHVALQIYGPITVFLALLPANLAQMAPVVSFLALADVLDTIKLMKSCVVSADRFADVTINFLTKHQAAYKSIGWIPKHHLAIELIAAFRRFGGLVGTLAQERMHKLTKKWSRDRYNKRGFERGLLEELTLEHLFLLGKPWWRYGLQDPICKCKKKLLACLKNLYPDATDFKTSRSIRVNTASVVSAGDVAFATVDGVRTLVEVWWLARHDNHEVACVSPWEPVSSHVQVPNTATYSKVSRPKMISGDALLVSAFYWDQGDTVVALVPVHM